MTHKKNIVLLGMMGVGKSTIGKIISKKIHMNFFDIDKIIENSSKLKIKDIFKIKGEDFFRKLEENETLNILEKKNSIISLGGGAFVNKKIRHKVLLGSISYWLNIAIEEIKKRLKNNKNRPLVNLYGVNNIEKIINERKKFYSQANYEINCDKLSLNQISDKIIKLYENNKAEN